MEGRRRLARPGSAARWGWPSTTGMFNCIAWVVSKWFVKSPLFALLKSAAGAVRRSRGLAGRSSRCCKWVLAYYRGLLAGRSPE